MENKIQELTEKIFAEGVTKGEVRAAEIIREAEEHAARLLKDAQERASQIQAKAEKESIALKERTEVELRQAAQQVQATIKNRIADGLMARLIAVPISGVLNDPLFLKDLIRSLIQKWDVRGEGMPEFTLIFPKEKQGVFEETFKAEATRELGPGLSVNFSGNFKGGFQILVKEAGYKISFTDQDFSEFFIQFLRPKTREFLFQD